MDDYRLISETIFYKSAFTHSMGGNQSQIITIADLPDQLLTFNPRYPAKLPGDPRKAGCFSV